MIEEQIFLAALEKKNLAEWVAFLDAACSGDMVLRRAVEKLLAAHHGECILDRPAPGAAVLSTMLGETVTAGVRIGPYTLQQLLGEGGMGSVWVAKQTEPVKRKVACKLIKPGMDSKAVVTRFEHERQALALMDHPSIARIFDGGITPDGRPFFVMELVNGLPLTKFCDEARLTPRQRLDLFLPICAAVQHAHQKGIVHRDLKPSNILVTLYDGKPVPKVIDFGLAKALAGKLTDDSVSTHFGETIGTLDYMAPEQAGFSALDIDTRADIYSLGVILYELLTGLKPIDGKRLRQAPLPEMIRIIQEEVPTRPSIRFTTEVTMPSLAALRQMEPRHLTEMLRGELDWIVMKCLEKSRDRRYETVNTLARDVRHFLADEPVEARPPSFRYNAGKFFRRNKGTALTAAVVVLSLVGGIIGTTLGMVEAMHQTEIANKAAEDSKRAEEKAENSEYKAVAHLWGAYLNEAKALQFSGRRGQRFEGLKAIQAALKLPLPKGRSLDELRNAAIAALCLPDIGDEPEWDPDVGPAVPEHSAFRGLLELRKVWALLPEPKFPLKGNYLSPERRFLLSALEPYDSTKQFRVRVRLWRVDGPEPQPVVLNDPSLHEEAVRFSPNDKHLALGHFDGTVSLYDTESGKEICTFKTGSGRVFCLEFHPTLPRLAVGAWDFETGRVSIFDFEGKALHRLTHPERIYSIAWRPDGRQLAVGCHDKRIYLWDAENGKQTTVPLTGHTSSGIRLFFSPAGDRLVSNDWSAHLRLWDTRTGREVFHTPENAIGYVEPGLFGVRQRGKKLGLLRVAEGQELRQVQGAKVHPDGRLVASYNLEIGYLDLASGEPVASVPVKGLQDRFFDESGSMGTINFDVFYRWPVRSTKTGYEIGPPEVLAKRPNEIHRYSCDKSGNVVAIPQYNQGTLVIHRNQNNRQVRLQPQYDVRNVAVSPDGRWVAAGTHWYENKGASIKIWDAATGKLVKELPIQKAIGLARFSPDNRWLLTSPDWTGFASTDPGKTFSWLWEVGTWKEAGKFPTLGIPVWEYDVFLEGQLDGTMVITQISTRKELARLTTPEGDRIVPQSLSASGFLVADGEGSRRMYVWDLPLIRRQLAAMGLDWDGPPYFSDKQMSFARSPYSVSLNYGSLEKAQKSVRKK